MAWNPSPKVKAARGYGDQYGKDTVIILGVDTLRSTMEVVTYGRTMTLCARAQQLGDIAYDAIYKFLEEENAE